MSETNETSGVAKWCNFKKKCIDQVLEEDKKFYFLKVPADYFDHPNARYILASGVDIAFTLYMKMMMLATPTKGYLRFSISKPYNAKLLAFMLFNAVKLEPIIYELISDWITMGIIERLDDGTLFLPEVPELMVSQTKNAKKQENYRKKKGKKYENDDAPVEYIEGLDEDEEDEEENKNKTN